MNELKKYYVSDKVQGKEYRRLILFYTCIIFLSFALVIAHVLPAWTLIFAAIVNARIPIIYHEYIHIPLKKQPYFMRILHFMGNPLSPGIAERAFSHLRHHASLNHPENDPDYPIIAGSAVKGFLWCLVEPELAMIFYYKHKPATLPVLGDAAIRLLTFCIVAYFTGWGVFWYLIPSRILTTINYFSFSHMLHRREEEFGTYRTKYSPFVEKVLFPIFVGSKYINAVYFHDVHHTNANIEVSALAQFTFLVRLESEHAEDKVIAVEPDEAIVGLKSQPQELSSERWTQ